MLVENRLEAARQRFTAVRQRLSEDAPPVLEARVLDGLGHIARAEGDFYWALQQLQEARKIYRREGLWMREATNLEYLAATYTALGDDTRARDHWNEAMDAQPVPWRQSIILMELATLEYLGGDYKLAEDQMRTAFKQRMEGCEQSETDKLMGKSEVLDRWSGALMYLEDFDAAIRASKSSLAILERLGYARELPMARSNLGVIYNAAGRFDEAFDLLDEALDTLPEGAYPHERAILHYRRAQSLRGLDRPREAKESLQTSLAWSEVVQSSMSTTALRTAFASRHHLFHDELLDLLLDQHFEAPSPDAGVEAWQVAEGVRARDLLYKVQSSGGREEVGRPMQSRGARHALLDELRRLEHQRLQAWVDAEDLDSTRAVQAEGRVADLERRQRDLILQLQSLETPAKPQAQGAPSVAPRPPDWPRLEDVQDLLDDDTVVLQFALGAQRSAVWWLDQEGLTAHVLPPRQTLDDLVLEVFEDLASSDQPADALELASRRRRLEALSQTLLGALAGRLQDQRLVIMADGALHLLPFGALLHPQDGHPILQHHRLVYLPSLQSLRALRQRGGPAAPLRSATVIADPRYHSRSDLGNEHRIPSRRVPRLPYSRQEAEAIRKGLGEAAQGQFFLGPEARQGVLANPERPQTALIHLSLHGEVDLARPEFSHLVFSLWNADDQPVDGRLYVHEIAGLDLSSQLLVLSACNTARGDIVSGEGLVGMPYAVLGAGAQRALLSLWYVDDEATALLMQTFYELLLEQHLPPDEALRRAQDRLRTDKKADWSAPYYWAGFVLYGDWRWPYPRP